MHLHDVDGDFESFAVRRRAEVLRQRDDPGGRQLRAWAAERGIAISPRGSVPAELVAAYREDLGLDRPVSTRDFTCLSCGATVAALPRTRSTLIVRTDFSDDDVWRDVAVAVLKPVDEGFRTDAELLDDMAFRDLSMLQVLNRIPDDYENKLLVIVDEVTISTPRHPVLVVDLVDEPGRSLRAEPTAVESIVDNITCATLRFASFAYYTDDDGMVAKL